MRTFLALTVLLLAACSDGADEEGRFGGPQASTIVPFEVAYLEDARTVQAVGTARARAQATVRAETAGVVEEVLFEAGQFVEAGAPLIALEAEDERLAVRLADVTVREAEQLLARYRRIEDTGAVSDSAIDEARTQLEAAKINLEQAQLRLAERTVRAPFDGYVGLSDVDPGNRVGPDTVLTAIDDRRLLYVDFNAPEEVFGQLGSGDRITVRPFTAEGPLKAEIVLLDSRVDNASRAFRVRAALPNEDDRLRPGMSFDVTFNIPGRQYPAVPEAAIVWGANGSFIWAVEDDKASRVPVQIVSRREGQVLIDAPLDRGSVIVAEGVQKVREGSTVSFAKASSRSGSTAGVAVGSSL
ncbi:efflux RND transporter periplasmic adaptor subunit [Parvularcula maris]|uniref:Efflux RND transporter periplasmic adaptor subunit n=1 Tax=Parvularcula maris TaxID=2965077 RepID=A0A9X2L7P9_9PROT|nr:efflux RND transporter periplasmic adaptor subunit [Parvularcula maris]MCQ8184643.1 efflux RND transporter periplasmic adaptor subunit [Parvularcula maris]